MSKVWFLASLLCCFSYVVIGQATKYQFGPNNEFHADQIVLKFKTPTSSNSRVAVSPETQLSSISDQIAIESYHQVFNGRTITNARVAESNLPNIYKLQLKPGTDIRKAISKLKRLETIEYAEPLYRNKLLLVPNDEQAQPENGLQKYLAVIRAYDGWQVEQSDSSVVIGIVDTGVNMNHEDLGNIAFNYDDPVNGFDDDNDGYVDNFHGWDLANKDNDPTADGHPHGTAVTGMSSATVNNQIGMAGTGFHSKYLPIKVAESTTQILINEYEGIIYAADQGCAVINLSWGGESRPSQFAQDVINYAVLERDAVVVAAAGNTAGDRDYYPASYDNVLSVGATDLLDNKAGWATHSYYIDLMAPGDNVFTTKNDGTYGYSIGTSFSSPLVAGAAALVRSYFPEMSAVQVMEQLRVTSDDIYSVGSNINFYGQLGSGRLNMHAALSNIVTPALRLTDQAYEAKFGDLIFPGDSVEVTLDFVNHLRTATNVTVTITNPSENVSLENYQFQVGQVDENETFSNSISPMVFTVNDDVETGESLVFRIDYTATGYTDFQYFEIHTTPDYFEVSDGKLAATVSSDGDIGYDDLYFRHGEGVTYLDEMISGNTGLIISLDTSHVMDNVINDYDKFTRDSDFAKMSSVRLHDDSFADIDARSSFKPRDTVASALDIKVEQKVLTWKSTDDSNFLIFEYRIINEGDSALTGINAGLYADWDFDDYEQNGASWHDEDEFGYIFDRTVGTNYAGIALLSEQTKSYFALDINSLHGNVPDIDMIFTDAMKHQFVSSEQLVKEAGTVGEGNDVAQVVGARDLLIEPKNSAKVTFAVLASNSLEGLRTALEEANEQYEHYKVDPPIGGTFYACDGDSAIIDLPGTIYKLYEDPFAQILIDSGEVFKTPPVYDEMQYYAVNLDSGYASDVVKVLVRPGNPHADFILKDSLLLEEGAGIELFIENKTQNGNIFSWDFGNGYGSNHKHPVTIYDLPGQYTIKLLATNESGCLDSISKTFLAVLRPERPILQDQEICKGTPTLLRASNSANINVYQDQALTNRLFTGAEFFTGPISSDTIFYVTNSTGLVESAATEVQIMVLKPELGFEYIPDTTDLNHKNSLFVFNTEGADTGIQWLVDGKWYSNAKSFSYLYSEDPFILTQIKVDNLGCTDTLHVTVTPAASPKPLLTDFEVCKKAPVNVQPENGELFYFYEDEDLSQLIHKGKSLTIPGGITENRIFYVTSIDELIESEVSDIRVNLNPLEAIIHVERDTLNLRNGSEVELHNQSVHALSSYWHWDTGIIDTASTIMEVYEEPGFYDYRLIANGSNGCSDTTVQIITVLNITGLEDELAQQVSIYPNPVTDMLTIDLDQPASEEIFIQLTDISGKILHEVVFSKSQQHYQIDMRGMNKGIYLVRTDSPEIPAFKKIIKL